MSGNFEPSTGHLNYNLGKNNEYCSNQCDCVALERDVIITRKELRHAGTIDRCMKHGMMLQYSNIVDANVNMLESRMG